MSTSQRLWVAVVAACAAAVLAVPIMLAASGDVPFWARDADCDGRVSLGEWLDLGIDYGWRPAIRGPPDCMEVFRFKDGLPVLLRCDSALRCRLIR
jgi:hypothetical protein